MLDLTAHHAEADLTLNAFTVKADGKAEDRYVYALDLVSEIKGVEDAEVLARILPGAVDLYEKASHDQDNRKFTVALNPGLEGIRFNIGNAHSSKGVVQGLGEVKQIKVRASKVATTCVFRIVMGGQSEEVASDLTRLLRNAASVVAEYDQQLLPFEGKKPPEVGHLVVAFDSDTGENMVGRLAETSERDGIVYYALENFDCDFQVAAENVVSNFVLEGDVAALVKSYKTRCKKRSISPTWDAVILAIAKSWDGALKGGKGQAVMLTTEHIEMAVNMIQDGSGEILPQEPGEHESGEDDEVGEEEEEE